jgi:hypothetical protein
MISIHAKKLICPPKNSLFLCGVIPFLLLFLKDGQDQQKSSPFFIASDTTKRRIKLIEQDYGKSLAEAISEKLSQNIYTVQYTNTILTSSARVRISWVNLASDMLWGIIFSSEKTFSK